MRDYLAMTENQPPEKPLHPAQILSKGANQLALTSEEDQKVAEEGFQRSSRMSEHSQAANKTKGNLQKVLSHKAI